MEKIRIQLLELAQAELEEVSNILLSMDVETRIAWVVEACRVLDMIFVREICKDEHRVSKESIPDRDTVIKGWNSFIAVALKDAAEFVGVPSMESTEITRNYATAILHQFGRYVLLKHTADILKFGMASAEFIDGVIVIRQPEGAISDHFLDMMEPEKLEKVTTKAAHPEPSNLLQSKNISGLLESMVFLWDMGKNKTVGYNSTPELDDYYTSEMQGLAVKFRDQAGIHPDSQFGKISGVILTQVLGVLMGIRRKHVDMVMAGGKKFPEINWFMSFTIWLDPEQLVNDIAIYTRIEPAKVSAAIDLLTLKNYQLAYFSTDPTPFVPVLIRLSEGYVLAPCSSLMRNPFIGVRMFQELNIPTLSDTMRMHREDWMASELNALFSDPRFFCTSGRQKLRKEGREITDLDSIIYDQETGELALFQLKWQDFGTNKVSKQVSKAKNFVAQIDVWASKVLAWLEEFGQEKLARDLKINKHWPRGITKVLLFAIGRFSARFRSYGFQPANRDIGVGSWPQFTRLRFENMQSDYPLAAIHSSLLEEKSAIVRRTPIPHTFIIKGQHIRFEAMWFYYNDSLDGYNEDSSVKL